MLVDGRFSHLGIVTNGDERLQEKKRGNNVTKKRESMLESLHYCNYISKAWLLYGCAGPKKKAWAKKT